MSAPFSSAGAFQCCSAKGLSHLGKLMAQLGLDTRINCAIRETSIDGAQRPASMASQECDPFVDG